MSTHLSAAEWASIRSQQLGRKVCAEPGCDHAPLRTSDMCGVHKRKNKHHAQATEAHGKVYPSKLEADRGAQLRWMQTCGEIRELREQVVVELAGCINYRADFRYVELPTERLDHEDSKGLEKERWHMIQRLWALWGPTPLLVSKRRGRGIEVVKTILPDLQRRRAFLLAQLALLDGGGA